MSSGTGLYTYNTKVMVGDAFVPGCALVNPIGVVFQILEGEQAEKLLDYMQALDQAFTPDGCFQTVEQYQSWIIQGYDELQREDCEYPQEY